MSRKKAKAKKREAKLRVKYSRINKFASKNLFFGVELPVDEDGFRLADSVDAEDGLNVVCGIPGSVEDDDAGGGDEVDSEAAGLRGNDE